MLYEAKPGTRAYKYIKGILEAEHKEQGAFRQRMEEAVGFKIEQFCGKTQNSNISRKVEVQGILVPNEMRKKLEQIKGKSLCLWELYPAIFVTNGTHFLACPNPRFKQGRKILLAFNSYHPVTNHFEIIKELGVNEPLDNDFAVTQLFDKDNRCFVYFDDDVLADERNPDLRKATMKEWQELKSQAARRSGWHKR